MKIVFDHVAKNYGIISALKDISFSLDKGEFLFLIGPSGSGKSTIIKLLLNQIKPTGGTITVGDTILNHAQKHQIDQIRRKIGVIFQDYQLIFDKTLEENISLALDIVNFSKELIPSKVDEVLGLTGLSSRRNLFPSQLSGGELQRAALARALSVEPDIILADEPTGNLDPENSWHLIRLLKNINEKYQTTILMTTHNYDIVNSLNNRILKILNGEIVNEETRHIPSVPKIKKIKKKVVKTKISK